jgi:glycosyltransferase involved in cell wall biosynthesis
MVTGLVAGKPVIATKTVGTKDYIVNGENGILVSPSDCKELARSMISIVDNPEARRVLGGRAFEFAHQNLRDEPHFHHLIRILDGVAS